ncbi:DNA/RNA non-specific endonuclease [Azospirillum sp. Vi22]|uniref:DNA/RNA non-specific endonuclease n=1 Tax=Azospirillum baldaniorum TaxID=1064539 RepID=UPI00157A7610|nr:DNA/RNA non-specific endonuclease [Azospirillum baldaniorum]NUB04604.1 DNA/RNA non-specific endonuclease [Azospirillum baldaniorum]
MLCGPRAVAHWVIAHALPALVLFAIPVTAYAAPTACSAHYAGAVAPNLINPKLATKTRELCYSAFAVLHSGVTRTPLYAVEHLTRDSVMAAKGLQRPEASAFHAEPRLPPDERAELADYKRSGYDRGHLVPSANEPTAKAQHESFSLANMIPQVGESNRGIWSAIEGATRHLGNTRGEVYVVTGPVFQGSNLQRIGGRVLVPTHVFKAIYDPRRREAAAYLVPNAPGNEYQRISIAELEDVTGIAVFPNISAEAKASPMSLPEPRAPGRGRKKDEPGFSESNVLKFLKELMR